jgi:hypothetical protein
MSLIFVTVFVRRFRLKDLPYSKDVLNKPILGRG